MKKKTIPLVVIFLTILTITYVCADELDGPDVPNPFIPQLPVKKVVVEDPKPTGDQKTPTNTTTQKPQGNTTTQNTTQTSKPKPPPLPQPNFNVTAIIWNTSRPQAVINGVVVDIGDSIDGFKIESIGPDEIGVSIRGVQMSVTP